MRNQTAKTRAKRYDLDYFKRPTRFKRLRLGFSVGVVVLAVLVLGGFLWKNKRNIYSPGHVSPAHAYIGGKCDSCHQPDKGFFHTVTDEACQKCHQIPDHHAKEQPASQTGNAGQDEETLHTCSSCHVEHRGREQLVRLEDGHCVECHRDLKSAPDPRHPENNSSDKASSASKPSADIANSIEQFNLGSCASHPEFKGTIPNSIEQFNSCASHPESKATPMVPTAINFSHKAHLGKPLLFPAPYPWGTAKPGAKQVTLTCWDCHRPLRDSEVGLWEYQKTGYGKPGLPPDSTRKLHPDSGREFMLIPNYERQCAGCHELESDKMLNDPTNALLEHPKQLEKELPSEIKKRLTGYLRVHPEKLQADSRYMPEDQYERTTREEWIADNANGLLTLTKKTCEYCHKYEPSNDEVPVVQKSYLKPPEMSHAIFSHQSHRSLKCEECHTRVFTADQSSDSLLPSIVTCRGCHKGNPGQAGQADNRCFLCHRYHDWPKAISKPGEYTIEQLTGSKQ